MTDVQVTGTILKGVGGAYTVALDNGGVVVCTARGLFRKKEITPLVGDRVEVNGTMLQSIFPRKNELVRPKAANMDQVIITMAAARPVFDRGLLDRFLLLAEHAGIPPVICINKWDLDENKIDYTPYVQAGYDVVATSCKNGLGIDSLKDVMRDRISVFAGPSGVGKSSLINKLTGSDIRETGKLSEKINRGKHTTRHTELLALNPSGYVVDTPGFSSLDVSSIPREKFAMLYKEFQPYINGCRFSDCKHDTEHDCLLKAQVGKTIHPLRYESYLKMVKL
jgi:ribosome biogenesis GTPase